MIPGRQTLGSIDGALKQQHKKIASVDRQLEEQAARLLELQREQVDHYRELARHRVDHIASGAILASVDDTERQVASLLRNREATAAELSQSIQSAEEERVRLEAQRDAQAEAVEQAAASVDAAEAQTQARLEGDESYQTQRKLAEEAERIAQRAEEKAARSEQEYQDKGRSYEDDALFTYLWERNYGTSDYRANPVARLLDRWVAKLIGYGDARANYKRLQELPLRLREHAEDTRAEAEGLIESLEVRDGQAKYADGIVALEDEQERQEKLLEDIDARLAEAAAGYQVLLERKERFTTGEDQSYKAVVDYLSSEFSQDDLRQLREEALATPYPEDDVIVNRMIEAMQTREDIEGSSRELKKLMRQHRERLAELEGLRAEFKHRRYDNPRSGFSDGAVVGMMLGNFLEGLLDRKNLWDGLEQQHRRSPGRANPDFGSGGFGSGTIWGGGAPRGGGFSFPKRRGGGFGGGGFKTGGGFGGGGGFKTGGGF